MKTTIISLQTKHVGNDNNKQQMMTSLEIAELTGKQHKNVMQAIRNMEPAWLKVHGLKFQLIEYKDQLGRLKPCYQLTKTECLYIATKFNDEARAKLVLRWEQLEMENVRKATGRRTKFGNGKGNLRLKKRRMRLPTMLTEPTEKNKQPMTIL